MLDRGIKTQGIQIWSLKNDKGMTSWGIYITELSIYLSGFPHT